MRRDFTYSIPVCHIRSASASGPRLKLSGWLYYKRISISQPADQRVQGYLYNDITGERMSLHTEFIAADELTAEAARGAGFDDHFDYPYDYHGCGFSLTLDPEALMNCPPGDYLILLKYRNMLKEGERILRGIHRDAVKRLKGMHFESRTKTLDLSVDPRQTLQLAVREKRSLPHRICSEPFEFRIGKTILRLSRKIRFLFR